MATRITGVTSKSPPPTMLFSERQMTAFPAPRATRARVSPTTRARACVSISECCRARSWAWTLTRSIGRGRRRCFAIELGFGVENVVFHADQDPVRVRLGKRLDIAQLARDGGALS